MENNRVIVKDLAVLTDASVEVSKYDSLTYAITVIGGQTKLLIGSRAPFNHVNIELGAVLNVIPAKMAAKYWNGLEFVSFVNLNDRTNALSKSGFIYFTTDKDEQWHRDDTDEINGLADYFSGVVIYDRYWMLLEFDVDLTPAVEIKTIGQRFSSDSDLAGKYPGLIDSCMLEGFAAGKTTWDEQAFLAASEIIDDLIDSFAITVAQNVLDPNQLKTASVHKVAGMIYNAFGKDYEDDAKKASGKYFAALNKLKPRVDKNNDGRLNPKEVRTNQRHMSR